MARFKSKKRMKFLAFSLGALLLTGGAFASFSGNLTVSSQVALNLNEGAHFVLTAAGGTHGGILPVHITEHSPKELIFEPGFMRANYRDVENIDKVIVQAAYNGQYFRGEGEIPFDRVNNGQWNYDESRFVEFQIHEDGQSAKVRAEFAALDDSAVIYFDIANIGLLPGIVNNISISPVYSLVNFPGVNEVLLPESSVRYNLSINGETINNSYNNDIFESTIIGQLERLSTNYIENSDEYRFLRLEIYVDPDYFLLHHLYHPPAVYSEIPANLVTHVFIINFEWRTEVPANNNNNQ